MSSACHACFRAGEEVCTATFFCPVCKHDRDVCNYLPGGLDTYDAKVRKVGAECVKCMEKRLAREKKSQCAALG